MISTVHDVDVKLMDFMGNDEQIAHAARVSVGEVSSEDIAPAKVAGLINYLLKARHGTPFEHGALTFYVAAPIFVFREFHRHRIEFSYNEMSGRYTELEPTFYLPGPDRPMINAGTSARPKMVPGDAELTAWFNGEVFEVYAHAWDVYKRALERGVAKEMARIPLPVGIYSRMYVTCNPRSLMSFLSLRTHEPDAAHPSHPQYEIELVARKLEAEFESLFPLTYAAFNAAHRVSP